MKPDRPDAAFIFDEAAGVDPAWWDRAASLFPGGGLPWDHIGTATHATTGGPFDAGSTVEKLLELKKLLPPPPRPSLDPFAFTDLDRFLGIRVMADRRMTKRVRVASYPTDRFIEYGPEDDDWFGIPNGYVRYEEVPSDDVCFLGDVCFMHPATLDAARFAMDPRACFLLTGI